VSAAGDSANDTAGPFWKSLVMRICPAGRRTMLTSMIVPGARFTVTGISATQVGGVVAVTWLHGTPKARSSTLATPLGNPWTVMVADVPGVTSKLCFVCVDPVTVTWMQLTSIGTVEIASVTTDVPSAPPGPLSFPVHAASSVARHDNARKPLPIFRFILVPLFRVGRKAPNVREKGRACKGYWVFAASGGARAPPYC